MKSEELRICKVCEKPKPLADFYSVTSTGGAGSYRIRTCKKCQSRRSADSFKRRRLADPKLYEAHLAYVKGRHLRMREEVFDHYGRVCVCCGETTEKFLTIDHIENIGSKKKRESLGQNRIYWYLTKHRFPDGFRVLCFNCNCGRAHNGGICPHQEASQTMAQASSSKRSEIPETREGQDIVEPVAKATAVLGSWSDNPVWPLTERVQ